MSNKNKTKFTFLNYFRPSLSLNSYLDLDLFLLKVNNIKLLICDLDNTLAPHFTTRPTKSVIDFINQVKQLGIKVYIVSNNRKKRVKKFVSYFKPDGYISFALKPFKRKIKNLLTKLKIKPEETLMMGDQFLIDIFVANKLGCKSILVAPLVEQERNKSNKFVNFIERKIHNKLAKNNILSDSKSFDNDTKLL